VTITIRVSAATHIGSVRSRNEDAFGLTGVGVVQAANRTAQLVVRERPFVAVVSDGLGGHPCGDRASALVVEAVLEHATADEDSLPAAIEAAHKRLADYSIANATCSGLAATAAAVLVVQEMFVVVNVGDSRVYAIEDDTPLTLLTVDDAPRGAGVPGFAPAGLTRTLGGPHSGRGTEPHIRTERIAPGTRLMMCTDGLSGHVPDAGVAACLRRHDGMTAVSALVDLALDAGGRDNVTVLLVEFTEPE
jgi:serine/threonine protein phosphatase PrpC